MVNSRIVRRLAPVAAVLLAGGTVEAHHSFSAEFDAKQPVTVRGTVTKARFVNPHSWLYLDVANKDGTITNWGFEFGTPNSLQTKGLSKEDVKPGTKVQIDGYRARNGGPFGYSRLLTLAGGRTVQTGGAFDAPVPVR